MSGGEGFPAPLQTGLRKNIAALYAVQAANFALPLVSVPYLVRALGASSYGLLAFAAALVVYLAAFTDFGFGTTATRAAAAARHDNQQLGALLAGVTLARLALLCACLLVLLALLAVSSKLAEHSAVYFASALSLFGTALFPGWLLQGIEAMRTLAVSTVIGRAISVLLIFAFVRTPEDVAIAAALQSLPLLIALVIVAKPVLARVPPRYWHIDARALPSLFSDSRNAFVSAGAITMYTSAATLALGFFAPAAAVGAFSAASKMVSALASILWAPISQGVYPRLSLLLADRSYSAAEQLLARILRHLLPLTAMLTLALWLLCEPLVRLVFGPDMGPAVPILRTLAPMPALLMLSNFFGVLVLFAHGEFAVVSRFQLAAAGVSLTWLIPLVYFDGAEGAAWSALITELLVTIGFVYLCRARGLLAWARTTSS